MKQTKLNYLLDRLVEEKAESIQIIQKAKAFGLDEVWDNVLHNPEKLSNMDRIQREINDERAVLSMIQSECIPQFAAINMEQINTKIQRVLKYMEYARGRGMVE